MAVGKENWPQSLQPLWLADPQKWWVIGHAIGSSPVKKKKKTSGKCRITWSKYMFLLLKDFSFLAILRWNVRWMKKQQQHSQSAIVKQTQKPQTWSKSVVKENNISNTGWMDFPWIPHFITTLGPLRQNDGGWRKINSSKTMRRFPLPPGRLAPSNWHNRDHELTNLGRSNNTNVI